jgi:hypothetical protein
LVRDRRHGLIHIRYPLTELVAGVTLANALAAAAISGSGERVTAAREIRRVITESRDRHTMAQAFLALNPSPLSSGSTIVAPPICSASPTGVSGLSAACSLPTPAPGSILQPSPNWNSEPTPWMPTRRSRSHSTRWTATSPPSTVTDAQHRSQRSNTLLSGSADTASKY